MRFIGFCLLFVLCCCAATKGQTDSLPSNNDTSLNATLAKLIPRPSADSVAHSKRAQFISDSIAMAFLAPSPLRENQFTMGFPKVFFSGEAPAHPASLKSTDSLRSGDIRNMRDPWIIITVLALLVFTALLNRFLNRDVNSILQSFYSSRALLQADKETSLISTWAFVGLFLLFSASFGLVLYELVVYYNTDFRVSGFNLFVLLALIVSALLLVKLFALMFLGFIFDIRRQVNRYLAILNLTYFNIAFVFLAAAVCFSLIDNRLIPTLLIFTLLLIAIIFVWQFFRNSLNIISDFRFHKFYLFIYLCALEICPILILIKALNI